MLAALVAISMFGDAVGLVISLCFQTLRFARCADRTRSDGHDVPHSLISQALDIGSIPNCGASRCGQVDRVIGAPALSHHASACLFQLPTTDAPELHGHLLVRRKVRPGVSFWVRHAFLRLFRTYLRVLSGLA
jgi:hypothetical protein